jgi:hypothetical protein
MALRAVEGIPNAMDMDFDGVDPDPTSLDIAPEGDGFATDETWPNYRRFRTSALPAASLWRGSEICLEVAVIRQTRQGGREIADWRMAK